MRKRPGSDSGREFSWSDVVSAIAGKLKGAKRVRVLAGEKEVARIRRQPEGCIVQPEEPLVHYRSPAAS